MGNLINRIKKVIGFLTGFVDNVRDFLTGLGVGISEALQKLPKMDFLAMSNRNRENLELANNNLLRVSNDLIDVGRDYSGGGLAVGLERADGDYLIISADDDEKKKEEDQTEVEVIPSDSVDGKPKEEEPKSVFIKSKKNTIEPAKMIEKYGADAVRLFILSDSPPEKDVKWSEEGMIASYKFIQKLWSLHNKIKSILNSEMITDKKINKTEEVNNDLFLPFLFVLLLYEFH